MRTQIIKIGNSLGNIIPATYIKQLGLVVGSDIDVKSDGNKLIIELVKCPKKRFDAYAK